MLTIINKSAQSLGYDSTMLLQDDGYPYDICAITLDPENDFEEKEPDVLLVNIYPFADDLDGSIFIQFYIQYQWNYDETNQPALLDKISEINRPLVLGSFNIDRDQKTIYFKYLHALPTHYKLKSGHLSDILDMCIYAFESSKEVFSGF